MTLDQLIAYPLAFALLAGPIFLLVLVGKQPELLSPIQKLSVSLVLIGVGFAIPLFIPEMLTGLYPATPLMVAFLCPLFVIPQGFVGVAIASALLALKLNPQTSRSANFVWWFVSLIGVIWSVTMVLMLGTAFADW